MRTLKKTLCLVLVLAMMVGLCAIGASAAVTFDDYTDKDAIKYPEAVKVLTKIEVLQGDDKGAFRGGESLNRAESCAFFTRLCAQTGAGNSTFTDMAAAAWAQPYVAFCQGMGIVAGMGDGTFCPLNPVTYIQWAKMCLVVAGYSPVYEGLVNDNAWEVNTLLLVSRLNLAAGIEKIEDWNAPITRDDASQMAFNTLKKTMVEYKGGMNVNVNTNDGTQVAVNEDPQIDTVKNNDYSYNSEGTGDGLMQVCEFYFPNLKLALGIDDSFGFTNNIWYWGDSRKDSNWTPTKTIATECADTIMATYTSNLVNGTTMYNDGAMNIAIGQNKLKVIENGQPKYNADGTEYTISLTNTSGKTFPLIGYGGATAYLVDKTPEGQTGHGIADTLIIKYPYLAKVTKVTEASATSSRYVDLTVYATTGTPIKDKDGKVTGTDYAQNAVKTTLTTTKFAKGDFVLVYPSLSYSEDYYVTETKNNLIGSATVLADSTNGTLTSVSMSGNVASGLTIEGVSYPVGATKLAALGPAANTIVACPVNGATYVINTGITAYTSNGYAMGVIPDAIAFSEYVFFYTAQPKTKGIFEKTAYEAGIVKQDGTTQVVDVSNMLAEAKTGYILPGQAQKVWGVMTPAGAKYALVPRADYSVDFTVGTSLVASQPTIGTPNADSQKAYKVVADAKTVFIIETATGIKSYTGVANIPNLTSTTAMTGVALRAKNTSHAAAIYINATGATVTPSSSDMLYIIGTTPVKWSNNGAKTIYSYAVIKSGEKEVSYVESDLYTLDYDALVIPTYTSGYLTGVEPATSGKTLASLRKAAGVTLSYEEGVLSTDTGYSCNVASDAVCYLINGITKTITEIITVADFDQLNDETGALSVVRVADKDYTAKAIYFVQ